MNFNQFLRALRKTPRDWRLTANGKIRRGPARASQCPVSALGGRPCGDYRAAGISIGLADELILCLAINADHGPGRNPPTQITLEIK